MDRRRVHTIPPGVSFVDALAAGLLARADGDPMALAGIGVYLPTRRACRALTEAFLRQTGGAALMPPTMSPIGDIDETELTFSAEGETAMSGVFDIPPAIPEMHRRLLLARLILGQREAVEGHGITPDQAARLAEELGRFLDQVQTERLTFGRLADLAPEEFADHWRITLTFLRILTEHWPEMLREQGCIDAADRRNRLIAAQIARWRDSPPAVTIVVAGSTGSVPATADLIAAVAGLPGGMVVLPGLDTSLDEETLAHIQPTHPQYAMVRLLRRLSMAVNEVAAWPGTEDDAPARAALLGLAMRPASVPPPPAPPDGDGVRRAVENVHRIDCATPQEESTVIALAMREALESPGKVAALVTPDRHLSRRVAAELRRWDIEVDDSAGAPLGDTAPGAFLRLTARLVAEHAAPISLLSCLKHPLAAGGMTPGLFRDRVRALEIAVLRGPRPKAGFAGLVEALGAESKDEPLVAWIAALTEAAEPFRKVLGMLDSLLPDIVAAHVAFTEFLARSADEIGAERLWSGEEGEQAAAFIRELHGAGALLGPAGGAAYPALFDSLMRGRVVRPRYGRHPRLHIWGPLEARLQQADLLILGGLNEGSWPPDPAPDPWMSRPMRVRFGLPPPERRVGLSAHDFAQAFSAREVMLTRATRVEGTPTVPSRWLLRLDNVLEAADSAGAMRAEQGRWLGWQAALDRPAPLVRVRAPGPCPPVAARPRRLSVTQIETLIRNPYAIYARHVLRLRPLDPIDADPAAAERGTIIHEALDRFLDRFPSALPDDALDALLAIGREAFGATLDRPGVRAFWWPRFERIADWFVDHERTRRGFLRAIHNEVTGRIELDAPAGPFVLTGKADRIDLHDDGGVEIIDYKTGSPPTKTNIERGFSPQLPLEALIARDGGFEGVGAVTPRRIALWRLSGGNPPAEQVGIDKDMEALIDGVRAGLLELIARYDDPETPYIPRPDPAHAPVRSDYDHLARVKEWAAVDGEERS